MSKVDADGYCLSDQESGIDWLKDLMMLEGDSSMEKALIEIRATAARESGVDPKSTLLHGPFDRRAREFARLEYILAMMAAERSGNSVNKTNKQALYLELHRSIYRGLLSVSWLVLRTRTLFPPPRGMKS